MMPHPVDPASPMEVLFETTVIGGQVRVVAIDGTTGTEVVVIAPLSASRAQMQTVAVAKLKRRLAQGAK